LSQQQQTERFFRATAGEWQQKAIGRSSEYNLIEGRNTAVLRTLESLPQARRFLDVGCGTGQLVIAAAQRGLEAVGVDFAKEMVDLCEANCRAAEVKADFFAKSIFDFSAPPDSYDAISAQGFIEYVAPDDMEEFFARSARMLRPGGALVVGSRNRLFNALSLNAFTQSELKIGVLDLLVRQAIALHMSESQEEAFAALRELGGVEPQHQQHQLTGIEVDTRFQYSPADLIFRLRRHGFVPRVLYPVHFHGLPIRVKAEQPHLHAEIANHVGSIAPTDHRIVPYCSTFVLDVRKEL
jgi:2-polyprenyl-3-methyl-5-hydroxy-6-metoxy-1,4-benzoquinol methylase